VKERIPRALRRCIPDHVPTFEWFTNTAVGQLLAGSSDPIVIVERLDLEDCRAVLDALRQYGRTPVSGDK
jgi:hypothetical protein